MLTVLTHLIESTSFAALVAIVMPVLRVRRPAVRHALWLLVVIQFAMPAVLFSALGSAAHAALPHVVIESWTTPIAMLPTPMPPGFPRVPPPTPWGDEVFLTVWLSGSLFALAVWLRRLACRRVPANPAPDSEVRVLERLRQRAGIRQRVSLHHADVSGPGLMGILRPVIHIPTRLHGSLEPREFESVLLHELAHVCRRDNMWSAFVHCVACVLWFHPLLWWIERRIAIESELACDELVLRWGAEAASYANGILKICRSHVEHALAGVSGIGSDLNGRIEWILSSRILLRDGVPARMAPALLAALMLTAPFVLGFLSEPTLYSQTLPAAPRLDAAALAALTTPPTQTIQKQKVQTLRASFLHDATVAPIVCWYQSIPFREGAVIRAEFISHDQMCITGTDGGAMWIDAAKTSHPSVGDVVFIPSPRNHASSAVLAAIAGAAEPVAHPDPSKQVCVPKASQSTTECSCESTGASSLGTVVRNAQGNRLVCDKWFTRKSAEWRISPSGDGYW